MAHLFVLDVTYLADVSEVDAHMAGHRAFLERHYAAGTLLASGRKVPRTGGVVLAHGERHAIEAMLTSDPFVEHGVARYTITESVPTMTSPELSHLTEPAPPA